MGYSGARTPVPSLRDKANDGVLCTLSIPKRAVRSGWEGGMDYGPSITTHMSHGWVTLLRPVRRALRVMN